MAVINNEPHIENDPSPDIPAEVDSERSPQLDLVVCRCRCGCTCASSRGEGENNDDGGGATTVRLPIAAAVNDAASEDGDSIKGEEGVAEHMVEIGDMGMISFRAIHVALARHERCTCHVGMLPDTDDYPWTGYNSLAASGRLSNSSMRAQASGDERSMSSLSLPRSAYSAATRSTTSSGFVRSVGGHFDHETAQPPLRTYFTNSPMFLNHEREFCLNMEIGIEYYAPELSIGESASMSSGHMEYDMW